MRLEQHPVRAVEGLDGTGKTTAALLFCEQYSERYYCWKDNLTARKLRDIFDGSRDFQRFFFYIAVSLETYVRAQQMRKYSPVCLDRTIVATIAYHRALGVPRSWMVLVPKQTLKQITHLLYFTTEEHVRIERMHQRSLTEGKSLNPNDQNSIRLNRCIDEEYRRVIPDRTIVIDTTARSPQETVIEIARLVHT